MSRRSTDEGVMDREQGPPGRPPDARSRDARAGDRQARHAVQRGDDRVRRQRQGTAASSTTSSPGTASPRSAGATSARASRSRSRAASRPGPGTTTRASATGRPRSSRRRSRCCRAARRRTTRRSPSADAHRGGRATEPPTRRPSAERPGRRADPRGARRLTNLPRTPPGRPRPLPSAVRASHFPSRGNTSTIFETWSCGPTMQTEPPSRTVPSIPRRSPSDAMTAPFVLRICTRPSRTREL